jgi:Phytanoyl-CoA dioxygenase (PhyH)
MQEDWPERYRRDGFAHLPGVFTSAEAGELAGYFDDILALGQGLTQVTKQGLAEFRVVPIAGKPTLKFAKWAASLHPGLDRFRQSPRLLETAMALLGPDLRQITNQMHYKNPGDGVSFQFHQDCTFRKPDTAYRNLDRSFLQIAIAVDPSTKENGCLQFVPGSHREAKALLEGGYEGWDANNRNLAVLDRFPEPVNGLMDPGDLIVWSPYTIHGSRPNRSAKPRRVYINGFARAADCDHGVMAAKAGQAVPLVWGPDTHWDSVEER